MSAKSEQQPQGITAQQAINTIDQALATIKTDRQGHITLQQCVAVVRKAMGSTASVTAAADTES